eukprot:Rmarinus@m.21492
MVESSSSEDAKSDTSGSTDSSNDETESFLGIRCLTVRDATADSSGVVRSAAADIVSRFQRLRYLRHDHLCECVDIIRGRHNRLLLVYEFFEDSLAQRVNDGRKFQEPMARKIAFQTLCALQYLDCQGVTHGSLTPQVIQFDPEGNTKICDFGTHWATMGGTLVPFSLSAASVMYTAPEVLLGGPNNPGAISNKGDVWSLGICLLVGMGVSLPWENKDSSGETIREMFRYFGVGENEEGSLWKDWLRNVSALQTCTKELFSVLVSSLEVNPIARPTPEELLLHPFFVTLFTATIHSNQIDSDVAKLIDFAQDKIPEGPRFSIPSLNRPSYLPWPAPRSLMPFKASKEPKSVSRLADSFHLWLQSVGSQAEGALGRVLGPSFERKPAILRVAAKVPHASSQTPHSPATGHASPRKCLDGMAPYEYRLFHLPLRSLLGARTGVTSSPIVSEKSVSDVKARRHGPGINGNSAGKSINSDGEETAALLPPLAVREHDTTYQAERVRLFRLLLSDLPDSLPEIRSEAKIDIPPLLRAEVWAALLEVEENVDEIYASIDKEKEGPADRQIEVDIPRCHQYNELLASHEGHTKLRRVLKAWVSVTEGRLVYWQGVDSLCAPLLCLFFENEARAFGCLRRLIEKYLAPFFVADNVHVLQEHLVSYTRVLAFHEPAVAIHFLSSGFQPELYAIPWLLTLFSHILSLSKVYHLWDTLLCYGDTLPLFLSVAMVRADLAHVRDMDFNSLLLHFSNWRCPMLEECIADALQMCTSTPPSVAHRISSQDAVDPISSSNPNDSEDAREGRVWDLLMDSSIEDISELTENCMLDFAKRKTPGSDETRRLPWLEELIPLEAQQQALLSRITLQDILPLLKENSKHYKEDNSGSSPQMEYNATWQWENGLVIIDVREQEEFQVAHLPGAVKVSPLLDGVAVSEILQNVVAKNRGALFVVVGHRTDSAASRCATLLLHLPTPHVVLLAGGIDAVLADPDAVCLLLSDKNPN